MKIRSLLNLLLKVLALFFIKDFMIFVPQLLSIFMYLSKPGSWFEILYTLLTTFVTAVVYSLVAYYLLFKTDMIIDKLKLTSGFEEDSVSFNMHRSTVLSIIIVVLGGYIVISELPNLGRILYVYIMQRRELYGYRNDNFSYLIASAVRILLGLFLLGNQRIIVNVIEWRSKKKN